MKLEEAVKILKLHQEWRMGADIDMPHAPRTITKALDVLLDRIEEKQQIVDIVEDISHVNKCKCGEEGYYSFTIGKYLCESCFHFEINK